MARLGNSSRRTAAPRMSSGAVPATRSLSMRQEPQLPYPRRQPIDLSAPYGACCAETGPRCEVEGTPSAPTQARRGKDLWRPCRHSPQGGHFETLIASRTGRRIVRRNMVCY